MVPNSRRRFDRLDLGIRVGHRHCEICQRGDGRVRLFDEDGRSLEACAPFNDSGDWWEYAVDEHCPLTGTIRFLGDALPAPGSLVRLSCPVNDC